MLLSLVRNEIIMLLLFDLLCFFHNKNIFLGIKFMQKHKLTFITQRQYIFEIFLIKIINIIHKQNKKIHEKIHLSKNTIFHTK